MHRRATIAVCVVLVMCGSITAFAGVTTERIKPHVSPLGEHKIGAPLSEVRGYKSSSDCLIEREKADCVFISPDGVEYVVLESNVVAVIASEKTSSQTVRLPFNLRFGDSIGVAIVKVVADGRGWLVGPGPSGGVTLSSYDRYGGVGDWDFNIELRFQHSRLVEIKYNSGTV